MTKSVTINSDSALKQIISIESIPKDVMEQLWYTKADLSHFRQEANNENNDDVDDKKNSLPLSECRKDYRRQFVQQILNQQEEHKSLGITDPKGLCVLSRACSKASRQAAALRAMDDALEVLDKPAEGHTQPPKTTTSPKFTKRKSQTSPKSPRERKQRDSIRNRRPSSLCAVAG